MKIARSLAARIVLKDVDFICCPKCQNEIRRASLAEDHCSLCTQPIGSINNEKLLQDEEIVRKDLNTRQLEISNSLEKLSQQQLVIRKEISDLLRNKLVVDETLVTAERDYDSAYLAEARTLEQQTGEIKAKIESLQRLLPLSQKVIKLREEASVLSLDEDRVKTELDRARSAAEKDATNIKELKGLFIENLIMVGLPGIEASDIVKINTSDFLPYITKFGEDQLSETEFANLGSGGKKTIFKCCFALAIHRLAAKRNVPLPTFLLIDTPMKNISERENQEIFSGFYDFLYKLFSTELSATQLIIVDKEYYPPNKDDSTTILSRHMTPSNPFHPPLITYYRGH